MSSKNRKYLPGGALNPAWVDEQEANHITKNIIDGLWELFNNLDINLNLELTEGVNINISNQNKKDMCTIVNDYDQKFDFIKRHSDTPEDLKLAKEIVGL